MTSGHIDEQINQLHGGRHDQAGGDRGSDRGCGLLECCKQHRGGGKDLISKLFLFSGRFWITLLGTPGGMLKVKPHYMIGIECFSRIDRDFDFRWGDGARTNCPEGSLPGWSFPCDRFNTD